MVLFFFFFQEKSRLGRTLRQSASGSICREAVDWPWKKILYKGIMDGNFLTGYLLVEACLHTHFTKPTFNRHAPLLVKMKAQVRPPLARESDTVVFYWVCLVQMNRSASSQSYGFLRRWARQFLLPMVPEMKRLTAFRRRISLTFIVWIVRFALMLMPTSVSIMALTAQHSMSMAAPSALKIVHV